MVEALTFIICKDPETDMLVTVFEDQAADPARQQLHSFQLAQVMYSLEALPVHIRETYYSVTKTSYATHAVKLYRLSPLIVAHSYSET